MLKDINESDERGFFCIDEDELEIYGNFSTDSNSHIEFLMLPCNTLFREWGYEGDTVADECIWDLQKQQEYLGQINVLLYFNEENYNSEEYGDKAIRRESKISRYYISNDQPSYFIELVKTNLLVDKTSYLQLFGHKEALYYNRDFEKNILTSTWN